MFARKEYPSELNNYKISSYDERITALNMTSLQRKRINSSAIMWYVILNGNTNCPAIKRAIIFNQNNRILRRAELFKIANKKMSASLATTLAQMCKFWKRVADKFTIATNRSSFINSIRTSYYWRCLWLINFYIEKIRRYEGEFAF